MKLIHGDCVEEMRKMPEASVDAVVCDPPYDLTSARPGGRSPATEGAVMRGFMGLKWDGSGIAFTVETWREALRVLKPGGYLLAFGGTRTFHRLACAVEDAGFEIRDCLSWMYGSGFPKSLDVAAAIDMKACRKELAKKLGRAPTKEELKAAWKTFREVAGLSRIRPPKSVTSEIYEYGQDRLKQPSDPETGRALVFAPATAEAAQWEGWGTALKPAWEPIIMARKPLAGTVAENVLEHGTGGINVGGCRIDASAPIQSSAGAGGFHPGHEDDVYQKGEGRNYREGGRWPANVVLDEEAAALLDEQSGLAKDAGQKGNQPRPTTDAGGASWKKGEHIAFHIGDSGGASRFFYCPKASRWEREAGLRGLPARTGAEAVGRKEGSAGLKSPRAGAGSTAEFVRNHHPTVKPVALMRWLVRLVTPPGGTVLDPFMGSGTTGMAAILEGVEFIGMEKEREYLEIAEKRIEYARANPRAFEGEKPVVVPDAEGQEMLFGDPR